MSRRHEFRFNDGMEDKFKSIVRWANERDENFDFKLTNTEILELCINHFWKLFVSPFEDNSKNTFEVLLKRYEKTGSHPSSETEQQLRNIRSQLLFMKMLLLNSTSLPSVDEFQSYNLPRTIAREREEKIFDIMKHDIEMKKKQQNR